MADSADPLFCYGDVAGPCGFPISAFASEQLGLSLDVLDFLQAGDYPSLIENGVRGTYTTLEIKLEIPDGKQLWNKLEGRSRGETRSMSRKQL